MTRRLFLGVPITTEVRDALQRKLKNIPGKVVPAENWHFTLQFLGNVDETDIISLHNRLLEISFGSSFDIDITHLGAFPNLHFAKILWLGITHGTNEFVKLNDTLCQILSSLNLPVDPRPFTPHLTLSRIPHPKNIQTWAKNMSIHKVSMVVDRLVLYESKLGENHSQYVELFNYVLS